jgi:hypothetical protein
VAIRFALKSVPQVKIAAHASVTFLKIRTSGINFSASDDEDTWTGSETMLRQLVYDCGGELKVVRGETEFRAHSVKSVNPVTLFRGELEFTPHLKVKVRFTRGPPCHAPVCVCA